MKKKIGVAGWLFLFLIFGVVYLFINESKKRGFIEVSKEFAVVVVLMGIIWGFYTFIHED